MRPGLAIFIRFYLKFRSRVLTKLPPGAKIFAVNHPTHFDAYPIFITLREFIHCTIDERIWTLPTLGFIFKHTDQIKVYRFDDAGRTYRSILDKLKEGFPILIAPEGEKERTKDWPEENRRAKKGVIRLALDAQVPIVPSAVWIDKDEVSIEEFYFPEYDSRSYNYKPKFRAKYGYVIGEPIYLDDYFDHEVTAEEMQDLATRVMNEIYKLEQIAADLFK